MFVLISFDYIYSITDQIMSGMNTGIVNVMTSLGMVSPITATAYLSYQNMRDLMYTSVVGILVPFLIFLSFASSFIDRNITLGDYLIGAFTIMIVTPLCIYLFSDVISNLMNINILDPAYMATSLISNFVYILVANMLLTLASFVFIIKGGARGTMSI